MCRKVKLTLLKFITQWVLIYRKDRYYRVLFKMFLQLKWSPARRYLKTLLECVSLGSVRDISEYTCARYERCLITAEVCREPETFVPPLSANFSRLFVPICSVLTPHELVILRPV